MLKILIYILLSVFSFQTHTYAADHKNYQQIVGYNFDIDDNILNLPTKIMLKNKTDGSEKAVSTHEFAKIRFLVGDPNNKDWKDYEINEKTSYRYFGDDSEKGKSLFADTIVDALKGPPNEWQGLGFASLIHALMDKEKAKNVRFITARSHEPSSTLEGFKIIQKFLKETYGITIYLPEEKNINVRGSTPELKAEILSKIVKNTESIPLPVLGRKILDQDGIMRKVLHQEGFSDDDLANFTKMVEHFQAEVKKGKYQNTKITLFYTGQNTPEVPPHSVVITNSGELRPTKEKEATYLKPRVIADFVSDPLKTLIDACRAVNQ